MAVRVLRGGEGGHSDPAAGDYPLAIDELKLVHCEDFRDDSEYTRHLDQLVRMLQEQPPPLGKLIGVPSLPAHFLSRSEGLTKLRDALRADLDSPVVIGGARCTDGRAVSKTMPLIFGLSRLLSFVPLPPHA